jgi:hypothetical protein
MFSVVKFGAGAGASPEDSWMDPAYERDAPAGRIRAEGFTFHGLRASSCEKLREAGCDDAMIESVTGSQPIVRRYLRFANQRQLAKAAILQLERNKPR